MAMNKQRRTANLNNIVTYDTLKNVTLLADLTIEGLTGAGFVKADANGLLSVDTGAYLPMPSQTGNAGKFLSTNGSVLSWQSVPQDINIYNNDGTLTGNRTVLMGSNTLTFEKDIIVSTFLTVGTGAFYGITNSAFGYRTLYSSTGSNQNTAIGYQALYNTTSGDRNTGVGGNVLLNNQTGRYNTAIGVGSLQNITNNSNIGIGYASGYTLTSGTFNTIIGIAFSASQPGVTTGSYNTIIGSQISGLSATLSNNIILADGQGNIRIRAFDTGNVTINGNTDSGYKLDVRGTLRTQDAVHIADSSIELGITGGNRYFKTNLNPLTFRIGTQDEGNFSGGQFSYRNQIAVGSTISALQLWMRNSLTNTIPSSNGAEFFAIPQANHQPTYLVLGMGDSAYGGGSSVSSILIYPGKNTTTNAFGDIYLAHDGTNIRGSVVVGSFSTNASAILKADSTTKGFLAPRMTNTQRTAISTPATGLMAYSTDATEGMYLNLSGGWQRLLTSGDTIANIYNSDGTLTGNRTINTNNAGTSYTLRINEGNEQGIIFHRQTLSSLPYFYGFSGKSVPIGTNGNATNYNVVASFNGNGLHLNAGQNISFSVYGTEVMRLNANNNFIVGNGSSFTDAGYKLDVQGAGRFTGDGSNNAIYIPTGKRIFFSNREISIGEGVTATYEAIGIGWNITASVLGNILIGKNLNNGTFTKVVMLTQSVGGITATAGSTLNIGSDNTSGIAIFGATSGTSSNREIAIYGTATGAGVEGNISIGRESVATGSYAIALGSYSEAAAGEFVAGSRDKPVTNVYFGGGNQSVARGVGTGTSYTINGSGAYGTDFAGGNITIAGGKGTGTGTPGDVIFSTATATTTGTTLQSLTNRWWIKGGSGVLSNVSSPTSGYVIDARGLSRFESALTYSSGIAVQAATATSNITFAAGASISSGSHVGSFVSSGTNTFNGNITIPNSAIASSQLLVNRVYLNSTGMTVTMTQGTTGIRALAGQVQVVQFDDASTTGTVSHMAGIQFLAPYKATGNQVTVTNYYGIAINPSDEYSTQVAVTNRWGIYQVGASDNNYFAGKVLIGTNTVGTYALDVNGTGRFNAASSGVAYTLEVRDTNSTSGSSLLLNFNNGTSTILQSRSAGFRLYSDNSKSFLGFNFSSGNIVLGGNESDYSSDKVNILGLNSNTTDGVGLSIADAGNTPGNGSGYNFVASAKIIASIRSTINSGFNNTGLRFVVGNNTGVLTEVFRITETQNVLIGSTTNVPSAILAATSTSKGFLPPRMTGAQAEAIGTPAEGLLVYANNGNGTTITTTGWWGYNGTTWVKLN